MLTDGSRARGPHRASPRRRRCSDRPAAACGRVYGRFSDRAALRSHARRAACDLFLALADELVGGPGRERDAGLVVCDAIEGYNPSHDVCRLLTGAAVDARAAATGATDRRLRLSARRQPRRLSGAPASGGAVGWSSTPRRSRASSRPRTAYPELRGEVTAALEALGAAAFRVECLRAARRGQRRPDVRRRPAVLRASRRATRGRGRLSRRASRFREHVRPIADALREAAASELVP